MKFNVGDLVMISDDVHEGENYDGFYFNDDMERQKQECEVLQVWEINAKHHCYSLERIVDGNNEHINWFYTDRMLVPYESNREEPDYKIVETEFLSFL